MGRLVFLDSVVSMPLMKLPVRSTYIPIQNGGILVSPGSSLAPYQLESLGNVTDLVAPNLFHHAGIMKANSIFPRAKKWAAQGAMLLKPEVAWTDELLAEKWPYQDEFPMFQLQGIPRVNEVVFFHKDSKSLIVTDLCFNLLDVTGIGSWIILNLFGTYRKLATSRLFVQFIKDKEAFEKSLGKIFSIDFENLVLSHGANIAGNAKEKLRNALAERDIRPR